MRFLLRRRARSRVAVTGWLTRAGPGCFFMLRLRSMQRFRSMARDHGPSIPLSFIASPLHRLVGLWLLETLAPDAHLIEMIDAVYDA